MTDGDSMHDTRDDLYDAYVEAALAGRAIPPEAFLEEQGITDDELRARLEAVYRAAERAAGASEADGDLPFTNLGPYRVLRRLDEGGMGMVYLGAEERLGRLVALKVLRPEYQGSATQAARFEREAQVVARLRHPHIVTIFGVGEEGGMRFLAMEYVEGEGLDEVIARSLEERRPVPVATAVRWAIQVAGALQAAHDVGVVHRDVKPSNIRIDPGGNAILLDFGIAAEEGTSRLTVAGAFLGTAAYSAPEQLRPEGLGDPDGRADVYSLGVILYEALTGVQPFDGKGQMDTVDRVFSADVTPARRLRSDLPRDLETVLQVCLERDRARRYASADAFAEDLRAVLEVRPIRARRPGPLRRTWKLARRHPVATVAILVGALAVIGTFVAEDFRRHRAAREALAAAGSGVQTFRQLCEEARSAEEQLVRLDRLLESKHMSDADDHALAAADNEVRASRREREAGFHSVLSSLRRAELLDPDLDGIDDVRAALFVERWREARTIGDDDAAAFYRQTALDLSPGEELAEVLRGTGTIAVHCDAPGASARVYHWELLSEIAPLGEPRLVPVPIGGAATLAPGAWAFRLVAAHDGLQAGDLVTRVAGEAPDVDSWSAQWDAVKGGAEVTAIGRDGRTVTRTLAAGADVRITTQPLEWVMGAEAVGGAGSDAPPAGLDCPYGPVLVVVRAAGHEESRTVHHVAAGAHTDVRAELVPLGTSPPGFVPIFPTSPNLTPPFWMQEREVTAAEYLEFLNDPATLAEIDADDSPIRYPRNLSNAATGGHWPRGDDGRFAVDPTWDLDWPIIAISHLDALAYCRWWTARARGRGEPWSAKLPAIDEWSAVGTPGSDRFYVYGNRFHPKWANSCFSRPEARVEPVMTYPRDESVYGVFDMSGSVWEWSSSWWDEEQGLRRVCGGSWARAPREFFKVWGGLGFKPEAASDENGFRLVLRRGETEDE